MAFQCVRYRTIQFKILCSTYISAVKLSKMAGIHSTVLGDMVVAVVHFYLLHLLGECLKVGAFWSKIISVMGEIYHFQFSHFSCCAQVRYLK